MTNTDSMNRAPYSPNDECAFLSLMPKGIITAYFTLSRRLGVLVIVILLQPRLPNGFDGRSRSMLSVFVNFILLNLEGPSRLMLRELWQVSVPVVVSIVANEVWSMIRYRRAGRLEGRSASS